MWTKQWTNVWKSRETGGKFLPSGGHIVDKKKVEK